MAWVACNADGEEVIYRDKPLRHFFFPYWIPNGNADNKYVTLPKGSIKKLIGRELTWADTCVELKEE